MGKKVKLIIHWDLGEGVPQVFRPKRGKRGWRVTERDGVQLMIIHEKGSDLRHEIPLASVLYWTVDTSVTSDDAGSQEPGDLYYCNTDKAYFKPDEAGLETHAKPGHDVRRLCCGSDPYHDHHPFCRSRRTDESEQRLGEIVNITEDDNGLQIFANLTDPNNFPHIKTEDRE